KRKVQNFTFALTALESTGALSNKSMSEDEFLGKAFSSVVPKELGGKLKNEPLKVSTSTSLAEGLKLKDNAGKIAQVNAARKRKEAMEDVGAVRLFLSSIGLKGISTDFKNVIKLSETALEEAKLRMTPKISEYQSYQDKAFGVTKSMNEEISTKMLNQYYEENSDAQETRFGMDEDEEFHGPWAARLRNQGSRKKRGPSAVVIPGVIITKDGEMIPEYDETIKIERCKSRVHRFVSHDLFENTILVLIMTSSVLLATETNTWPVAGSTTANVYENIDIGFTTVFAMECALKIFAYGLYKRPTAYLKNSFNILDAVVVLGSAFSLVIGDSGGSAVRTLRILRILRPLRSVRRFPGVRLVVNTVISSIPAVSYVCLLGLASMSIFALLGMEFFMGEFWSCRAVEDARSYTTRGACEAAGGVWRNAKFNFDNFGAALLSTFILHAGDDWQEIMWVAMDSTGYGTGYKQDNNQSAAAYFVITVLIGNFFWVNLLATALVDNFNKMASQDKLTFATPAQRRWQQAMMRAAAADLGAWRKIVPPPGNGLWSRARLAAHTVAKAKTFSFFVVGVVTANLMTALAETANMSQAEINIHYYLNTTFTIIYVLEMVILLMAQGKKRYLLTYWNWLDSFVVVVSVVDIIGQSFEVGGIMAYLKLVRLLRLLKLVNAHAGLRSLFTTFIMSIPAVANVAALSALAIFAYAIMGVSLFGDKRGPYEGGTVSNYFNFESFPTAFAALMGVYTGGWVGTFGELYQTEACLRDEPPFMSESSIDCDYNYIAIPYFISFVVVSIFLLGNLFVAIILERFSVTADQEGVYDASEVIEIIKHTIQLRRLCTSIKRKVTKAREPGGKLHGRGRDMDKDERPGSIFNKLIRRVSRRNSRSSLSGDGSPKEGKVRANRNKLSSDQREVIEMNVEVSDDEHFFSPAPSYRSKERVSPYFSLEREPEPEEEPKDEPEDAPEPAVEASTIATIFGKRVGENRFGRRASSATQSATESDDSEFEAGDEEFEAYPFERRTVRARHHPGMNTPADVLSEFAHSERSAGSRSVESYDDERSASEDDHSAYNDQSGTYTSSEEAYRFGVTGERTTPSRLNDYLYDFRDDVTQRPQAVSSLLGSDDGATLGSENESDSDDEPGASKSGVSAVLNRL
ncbi:Voltage-dependent channel, four helix bundle domain, partial [Ostreococcus tauri]